MGDISKIFLGPVDIEWKKYDGTYTTGWTSFGYLTEKGAKFHYKGDELNIKSGNRLGIVKQELIAEEATLTAALEEFTIDNLATAFGIDADDIQDDEVNNYKYIQIGGNKDSVEFSAKITAHLEPRTSLVLVLFRIVAKKDQKLAFAPDKLLETPIEFEALGDIAPGTAKKIGYIEIA